MLHSNPEAREHAGMSKAKTDEWLHADRGSPWKHRASGGGLADAPTVSREDDAEILSRGRRQSPNLDLNLTPTPDIRAPIGNIPYRDDPSYMPGPIPNDRGDFSPKPKKGVRLSGGGLVPHRDAGGGLTSDPGAGIGGISPTAQNQNPLVQGQIQQYSSMPTEKLYELQARLGGSPQGAMIQKLIQQRHVSPQAQPAAPQQIGTAGQGYKRGGTVKRDGGGGLSSSEASPWWTRQDARGETAGGGGGFLHGTTPGRADSVQTTAPGGSYVLPADVIAGLGAGNSLAGARVMDAITSSGPHGATLPRAGGGRGIPRAPAPFREQARGGEVKLFPEKKAAGGVKDGSTPVALSHGEYIIPVSFIMKIGGGDLKRGHRILDQWVLALRKKQIETLKKLPGPVGAKK